MVAGLLFIWAPKSSYIKNSSSNDISGLQTTNKTFFNKKSTIQIPHLQIRQPETGTFFLHPFSPPWLHQALPPAAPAAPAAAAEPSPAAASAGAPSATTLEESEVTEPMVAVALPQWFFFFSNRLGVGKTPWGNKPPKVISRNFSHKRCMKKTNTKRRQQRVFWYLSASDSLNLSPKKRQIFSATFHRRTLPNSRRNLCE